jgi:hypothetical protein
MLKKYHLGLVNYCTHQNRFEKRSANLKGFGIYGIYGGCSSIGTTKLYYSYAIKLFDRAFVYDCEN